MADVTTQTIRYSPRPLEAYRREGVAISILIDSPAIWNLAYLSADYDGLGDPQDPQFLTLVRRTCQVDLRTLLPDLTGGIRDGGKFLVGKFLLRPAPWFVRYLMHTPTLTSALPMFAAYGPGWLSEVNNRARKCATHDVPPDTFTDVNQAAQILRRYAGP